MKPKIIFLDVDGVLNHSSFRDFAGFTAVSKHCCEVLASILIATDAKIVISSMWRVTEDNVSNTLRQCMEKAELTTHLTEIVISSIVGQTLDFDEPNRWREIEEWLDNNEHSKFAVLDDSFELFEGGNPSILKNLVLTDDEIGLGFSQADQVIALLS